jgi:adenosylcobinamide-GDP ribazoletransferase
MPDSLRLAIGTFTRLPVPAPRRIDARTAGRAMLLGPAVALVVALVVSVPVQVLVNVSPAGGLLGAVVAVAAMAWLTRGIHLDGLADTADALGSGRPAAEALEIARRSDIGPSGVMTLVLVLLAQVVALGQLLDTGAGAGSLVVAVVAGRVGIAVACRRGVPPARSDGLGAAVAGSVAGWAAWAWAVGWTLFSAGSVTNAHGLGAGVATGAAVVGGLAAGLALTTLAVRRLGGITGDVLGAIAEVATATVLVILVALPG